MPFYLFFKSHKPRVTKPIRQVFRSPGLELLESRLTPTASYDPSSLLIRLQPNAVGIYPSQPIPLLAGVQLEHAYSLVPGLWRAKLVDSSLDVQNVITQLSHDARVAYAVPNGLNQEESTPNDPRFANQWHLAQPVGPSIHATAAWDSFTGSGVTVVAVFDSGVDVNHPDLKSRIWTNGSELAGDGVDNDGNGVIDDLHGASFSQGVVSGSVQDSDGHGTAVAGLIGAAGNNGVGVTGVNWNTTLLPLKVIQGGQALDGDILQAMDYAAKAGAKIWNLSLGGGAYSRAMSDAMDAASSKGFIIVSAAGNNSQNNDTTPHFPSSYTAENVIAVAATDSNDALARFSNFGLASVDIAAPGTNLLTTLPGGNYGTRQGTSMAAALVSGAISLIWDRNPGASASQVLDSLMNGTKSLDTLKGVVTAGGRLDLNFLNDRIVDSRIPPVAGGVANNQGSTSITLPGGGTASKTPSFPELYDGSVTSPPKTPPQVVPPVAPNPGLSLGSPVSGKPVTPPPMFVPPSLGTPFQPPTFGLGNLPNPGISNPPIILPDPGTPGPVPNAKANPIPPVAAIVPVFSNEKPIIAPTIPTTPAPLPVPVLPVLISLPVSGLLSPVPVPIPTDLEVPILTPVPTPGKTVLELPENQKNLPVPTSPTEFSDEEIWENYEEWESWSLQVEVVH